MRIPTLDDVRAAALRIAPHVHRTPVLTSATLDREVGAAVFFKCENLQKCGAFKARGAANAVFALDAAAARAGVITHSSGNHGAALAYAAGRRGIACTVVVPDDAPAVKVAAMRGYGAEVVFCKRAERDAVCARLAAERGATLVPPFDDFHVVAGQGTAALELIEQVPGLDAVVAPVGGGGLLAGTAIATRALLPRARVLGAEPEAVDDAARSLATGVRQPGVSGAKTLADGLMTGLGELNFAVLRDLAVEIVTVSEAAMRDAARFLVERMKLVVEPSGAVGLAAVRARAEGLRGRRVGVILSGGNTDLRWLHQP
ncbi:MAG: pyridoxal-phosphate dependent enzyme [Planctomycetes bacterium]|nr:pyridoxal-phosphate dependent enzyme [Planctomycetota bacterium]